MSKAHLEKAKKKRNDEFYTRRETVEAELQHYEAEFRGKTVFLPCDDPERSQFWAFFTDHLNSWGIRRLSAVCFRPGERATAWHLEPGDSAPTAVPLDCDGDFRSEPSRILMQETDITVTNPPFSLVRPFFKQLMETAARFLIVAPLTVFNCRAVFEQIAGGRVRCGVHSSHNMYFNTPDGERGMASICWLTNMHPKNAPLRAASTRPVKTEPFGNYDAVNVNSARAFPTDYDGVIGVPITYLLHHDPERFDILASTNFPSEFARPFTARTLRADGTTGPEYTYTHGAFVPVTELAPGRVHYESGGKYYRQTFPRVLIQRRKGSGAA